MSSVSWAKAHFKKGTTMDVRELQAVQKNVQVLGTDYVDKDTRKQHEDAQASAIVYRRSQNT